MRLSEVKRWVQEGKDDGGMKKCTYEIEFGDCFCYCSKFVINGTEAQYEDFGVKFDRDEENAPDYGCGDMRFTRHTNKKKIAECLKKYDITKYQFDEIASKLEEGLSFGFCYLCE